MMDKEQAVDFIRNINDFSSEEKDFNWSKESEEWWDNFKRTKLLRLDIDGDGKVLVVLENDGVGYAQMKWVRTLAAIINEGRKRELKEDHIDVESFERVDVDGTEYAQINTMAHMMLTTMSYGYLADQYSA